MKILFALRPRIAGGIEILRDMSSRATRKHEWAFTGQKKDLEPPLQGFHKALNAFDAMRRTTVNNQKGPLPVTERFKKPIRTSAPHPHARP